MTPQENPYIKPTDYFEGYNESINKLKNNPEAIQFDRLCYELFEMTQLGKDFMTIVKDRFILPGLAKPGSATFQIDCIWAEGFKDFPRTILGHIRSHQQRIQAEVNKV